MPSLRIPFPDKDNPSIIALRGNRITVGRLSDNAIQIPDRTVSAHHAELILEKGHYRVHDLGATNGIQVNGQLVTDFHLAETCKVTFGGVDCEFSPETPAEDAVDFDKALVTRAEADALKEEIAKLQAQVTAFRQEVDALKQSHASRNGEATVPQAEFDRVTGELTGMALKVVETERQLNHLRTELGVLRRDRENLQRALDEAREKASASTLTPVEPGVENAVEVPSDTAAPDSPEEVATADAAEAPAVEDSSAPSPVQTLTPPTPKPLFVPGSGSGEQAPAVPARPQMPTALPPKSPGQLQPAASARPGFAGSGLRPATFAKPAATPVAKPGTPVVKPAAPGASTFQGKTGLAAKAGIPTKPPMAAVPKAVPAGAKPAPAAAGPKGTQKLG
jgi:hypothetical protein